MIFLFCSHYEHHYCFIFFLWNMLQKRFFKLHKFILLTALPSKKVISTRQLQETVGTSLQYTNSNKLLNTGNFFKYFAFIGLGLLNVSQNRYKTMTTRSTLLVLWDTIAAHTMIF